MRREVTYNVEILTTEDLWSKYGSKLPDRIEKTPIKSETNWCGWAIRALGALLSVALHVVLIGGAMLGTNGRPPSIPLVEGAAATGQNDSATEFVSVMLFINDNSISQKDDTVESAYATPLLVQEKKVESELLSTVGAQSPPPIGGDDELGDEESESGEAFGAEGGRAVLFGRYMGQVKARIERAWERPVAAASSDFDCSVQIKQDSRGEVQEVTLQRCKDDPAWQVSLVQAIQRASPLSAPPTEDVFSDVITLSFAS
ncbi:MAG TPA: TonB C-terminal domain-containing protein, partial [Steroidobacteraceae bacterium]|nr:TonB C-terminal domain-containing protein [Steroidobacteraceae bacterium]